MDMMCINLIKIICLLNFLKFIYDNHVHKVLTSNDMSQVIFSTVKVVANLPNLV